MSGHHRGWQLTMRVTEIQAYLQSQGLDGWLLCDFQGSNPIARRIADLEKALITRRWFCLIPAQGQASWLCHRIERNLFEDLAGEHRVYASWGELDRQLQELLKGVSRVAMEYSPEGEIPYVARVDAGTVERLRRIGIDIMSSAELVQLCEARWTPEALALHLRAAATLYEVKDRALEFVRKRLSSGKGTTEYEVQQAMARMFQELGLTTNSPPIVAVNEHTSEPHYIPSESGHCPLRPGDFLLLDLWAKYSGPAAVYADITWVAYLGSEPSRRHQEVFELVRSARDRGVEFISESWKAGRQLHGFEVDDEVRRTVAQAGYGQYFTHRTGHSLGAEDHGNGVNLDNFETHDTRTLIPGVAFSIEPGLYLPEFGVRSEINVYLSESGPRVTTLPVQQEITCVCR